MFTWICPQCGREVPPSYSECPDCAERAKAPAATQPPGEQQMPPQAIPPTPPVMPPQAQPQVIYVQKPSQPGWLVALLVAAVLVGAGAAAYYFLLPSARAQREASSDEGAGAAMEEAPKAGETPTTGARLGRFIEVTGLRIVEADRKPEIRYVLVNHSSADLAGLKGQVLLRSTKAGPDDDPIAVVPMELNSLRSYEVKEIIAPLKSKLRAYEYPDWQFLKGELKLTAP